MPTDRPTETEGEQLPCRFIMEFYPAIKKNEIMSSKGKWIKTEMVILNEMNQFRKSNIAYFQWWIEMQTKRKEKAKYKRRNTGLWKDIEKDGGCRPA